MWKSKLFDGNLNEKQIEVTDLLNALSKRKAAEAKVVSGEVDKKHVVFVFYRD